MPFTPFHLGPALAVKSAVPRYFSLPIFWVTQVAIDLEVLAGYFIIGDLSNHAVLHTFGGATLVALSILLLSRPVFQPLFRLWNQLVGTKPGTIWHIGTPVPWTAFMLSAFGGGWSHALLDAMLYPNNTPFAPLSDANVFYAFVWTLSVVPICVASGAIGGGILLWQHFGRYAS